MSKLKSRPAQPPVRTCRRSPALGGAACMRAILRMKCAARGVMVTDMMRASHRRQITRMLGIEQYRVVHRTDGNALGLVEKSNALGALLRHDQEQRLAFD